MNDSTTGGVGSQSDQLGELKSAVLASPNAVAITNREGIIVWVRAPLSGTCPLLHRPHQPSLLG
jgi:hypothetical protein